MKIANNRQTALLILIALGISVLSTLVGDTAKTIIDSVFDTESWVFSAAAVFLVSFALYAALLLVLLQRLDKIVGATVQTRTALKDRTIKYLIMGYSPLKVPDIEQAMERLIAELDELGTETVSGSNETYQQELQVPDGGRPMQNPWQQNLRAAWAHRKTLKKILVLNPDMDQFAYIKKYLGHALAMSNIDVSIELITHPEDSAAPFATWDDQTGNRVEPSYENYLYVYQGLSHGLKMISSGAFNFDKNTCVDATPGFKPFSIAAAILTLKRPLVFSYITTGGIPKYYDVDLTIGRTAG